MFNNIYTYVYGGLDQRLPGLRHLRQDPLQRQRQRSDLPTPRDAELPLEPAAAVPADDRLPQPLADRALQRLRPTHELKTDGTYFVSNKLGGDHSLKFGLGYRRARPRPSRTTPAARAPTCSATATSSPTATDNRIAPGAAGPGMVPYRAELYRDQLRNSVWWSYNGYIQDSFSRGKWRVNGGLRYDWQHSKYNGGCVPENVHPPDLLPAQCEEATQSGINPNTGQMERSSRSATCRRASR